MNKNEDAIAAIAIGKIIRKYSRKEKAVATANALFDLEKDLQRRCRKAKSQGFTGFTDFSFPEIKNVLDCIADILSYYKEKNQRRPIAVRPVVARLITQTIHSIKNASQETLCSDITIDKCPSKNTISTITDANHQGFFNVKNENVIYRYGKQYCKNNVYETPYGGVKYPYAYCIRVMVQSLTVLQALTASATSDRESESVLQERYHYYIDYIIGNAPNIFILPTLRSISEATLIQTRSSRIQLCGIHSVWHDINRIRRIYQNNVWYSKQHKIPIDTLYAIMRKYGQSSGRKNNNKVLFKILIKDALPFTKDTIENALVSSGNCYPHERAFDNVETGNRYNRVNLRYYERSEL
jgi:hypothetical protein